MIVRTLVCIAALIVAAGCFPSRRGCSRVKTEAASVFTITLSGIGESELDYDTVRPLVLEFKDLAYACKLPPGEVADLHARAKAADADKTITSEELLPLIVRMEMLVVRGGGKTRLPPHTLDPVALLAKKEGLAVPPLRASANAPQKPDEPAEPKETIGNCSFRPLKPLDNLPFLDKALGSASQEERAAARAVDEDSITADWNLRALASAEIEHFDRTKQFLAFQKGDATHWKKLDVKFPRPVKHSYKAARGPKGAFRILAEANLDKDPFVDRWYIEVKEGSRECPSPALLASDTNNATFEDGTPRIVPPGEPQPKAKLF